MDWGGGSSEITFASSQKNQTDKSSGSKLEIFSRSDECFGQSKVFLIIRLKLKLSANSTLIPLKILKNFSCDLFFSEGKS